ncbi:MAG: class I SAM-dependent methyltransferase [Candidatus Nanopelagicales bacterium]
MPSEDEILRAQRRTWAALAAGWEKWDGVIMDQLAPASAAIIGSLGLADGHRHLDVASGTGEPGLTVAGLVPSGRVVLTDLSAEMLAVAMRRARAMNVTNVETRVCGVDALPFEDAAFDSVSVRFGYMFFPDLYAATAELARVLRPGGRLCSSVWAGRDVNPWTTLVLDAIGAEVELPPAPPGAPGMFRCAEPGQLSRVYDAAGLRDVSEWDVPVELVTDSPEQAWEMLSEHVSLAVAALAHLDPGARERVARAVVDRVSEYQSDGRIRLPGVARCVVGTR